MSPVAVAQHDRRARLNRGLSWLGERIAYFGLWLAAAALLAIVVLNAANIVLRYVFFAAFSWAEEAMLYLMIFGVYAGAISVAWQQAHIRIDAFVAMAPPRWHRVFNIVGTLLLAAILVPVVLASARVVTLLFEFDQRSDALHLPMWIAQGVIPAALTMIVVMSFVRLFVHAPGNEVEPRDPLGRDSV
jgi:TRAP-type C4-dicarboxylate transport system permease small subunit